MANSSTITAGICEDEFHSREALLKLIGRSCPEVEVLFAVSGVDEAKEALETHVIDVLFLDIQLKGKLGFDLLEEIEDVDFEVVFTTSYADYAIHAIRFYALDYLLKPIGMEELMGAVGRVRKELRKKEKHLALRQLQKAVLEPNSQLSKIALPVFDGLFFVKVGEIIRCEADGRYSRIYLVGGKQEMVSRHLKEFEQILIPFGFVRVHRLHIVNLHHIVHYTRGEGGSITLTEGQEVDVSRRRKKLFLESLNRM